jgi:hypothetical protein
MLLVLVTVVVGVVLLVVFSGPGGPGTLAGTHRLPLQRYTTVPLALPVALAGITGTGSRRCQRSQGAVTQENSQALPVHHSGLSMPLARAVPLRVGLSEGITFHWHFRCPNVTNELEVILLKSGVGVLLRVEEHSAKAAPTTVNYSHINLEAP